MRTRRTPEACIGRVMQRVVIRADDESEAGPPGEGGHPDFEETPLEQGDRRAHANALYGPPQGRIRRMFPRKM